MNPERTALWRAIKVTGAVLGILAVASGCIAWALGGPGEAWAAIAGIGVVAFVGVSTQFAMLVGSRFSPKALAAIVFGSFLVKVTILLGIMWAVARSETFPRGVFVISLLVGAVATLAIDLAVVARARVPYVSTGPGGEAG
jgi:hypothetical protein